MIMLVPKNTDIFTDGTDNLLILINADIYCRFYFFLKWWKWDLCFYKWKGDDKD